MWRYFIKRILLALLSIFIILFITFFAMNAIPGGPFDKEKALDPVVKQILLERYGLDRSVPEQFVDYVGGLLRGDLGISLKTGRPISQIIGESFPISATLGGVAAFSALITGLLLGMVAALKRNGWQDRLIVFSTNLLVSVPSFVLATLLMLFVCLKWALVPGWSVNADWRSYILPVASLAAYPTAYITRLTKSSMLDVLGQDYVRTARAKGVRQRKVIYKHALKNAVLPVVTYFGPMLAYILTGSLVVESIFTIGGLGSKFVSCIVNRDYSLIMGTTIFLATIMVLMNLIGDLVYKVIDPRIKFD